MPESQAIAPFSQWKILSLIPAHPGTRIAYISNYNVGTDQKPKWRLYYDYVYAFGVIEDPGEPGYTEVRALVSDFECPANLKPVSSDEVILVPPDYLAKLVVDKSNPSHAHLELIEAEDC